jgi:hypothetical protein
MTAIKAKIATEPTSPKARAAFPFMLLFEDQKEILTDQNTQLETGGGTINSKK